MNEQQSLFRMPVDGVLTTGGSEHVAGPEPLVGAAAADAEEDDAVVVG